MPADLDLIVKLSLAAVAAELLYRLVTRSAPLPRRALALGAGACLYAFAPAVVQTKDGLDEAVAIVICYLSMVLGMAAQYAYDQAERGHERFELNWMTFLMPIFASPIVFIPLLTLTSEVAMGGAFTRAKLMVYLVAFQNGFFWKSFFEQRKEAVRRDVPAALPNAAGG